MVATELVAWSPPAPGSATPTTAATATSAALGTVTSEVALGSAVVAAGASAAATSVGPVARAVLGREKFGRFVRDALDVQWYRSKMPPARFRALSQRSDAKAWRQAGGHFGLFCLTGSYGTPGDSTASMASSFRGFLRYWGDSVRPTPASVNGYDVYVTTTGEIVR